MQATDSRTFISPSIIEAAQVDAELPVTHDSNRDDEAREKWQDFIDHRLIEWGWNPSQFDGEGIEPPSRETIGRAIKVAQALSKASRAAAPTRVVPDAHGGIVFERQVEDVFETVRISADGDIEYCVFDKSRLVHHEYW